MLVQAEKGKEPFYRGTQLTFVKDGNNQHAVYCFMVHQEHLDTFHNDMQKIYTNEERVLTLKRLCKNAVPFWTDNYGELPLCKVGISINPNAYKQELAEECELYKALDADDEYCLGVASSELGPLPDRLTESVMYTNACKTGKLPPIYMDNQDIGVRLLVNAPNVSKVVKVLEASGQPVSSIWPFTQHECVVVLKSNCSFV